MNEKERELFEGLLNEFIAIRKEMKAFKRNYAIIWVGVFTIAIILRIFELWRVSLFGI